MLAASWGWGDCHPGSPHHLGHLLADWWRVRCPVHTQSSSQKTGESPSLTSSHGTRPGPFRSSAMHDTSPHGSWHNCDSRVIGHAFKFCLVAQKAQPSAQRCACRREPTRPCLGVLWLQEHSPHKLKQGKSGGGWGWARGTGIGGDKKVVGQAARPHEATGPEQKGTREQTGYLPPLGVCFIFLSLHTAWL